MILGIQELMKQSDRSLQGEFAHLSLEDLEDMIRKWSYYICAEILKFIYLNVIVQNEIHISQRLREIKTHRSRSRGAVAPTQRPQSAIIQYSGEVQEPIIMEKPNLVNQRVPVQ